MSEKQPWQTRLQEERDQLLERVTKLTRFANTDSFTDLPLYQRDLLERQELAMYEYLRILDVRLSLL